MLLTIAVPTYNRAVTVAGVLQHLLTQPASELVEILVVDDGSTDDTFGALAEDPTIASRVRILRNDQNQGYPRTFIRILAECKTEYVMLVADDDHIIAENLAPLLDHLEKERPTFSSPQFLRGSTIYRGRPATGPIAPKDFLTAAAHAPGLIYRIADCRDALADLSARVEAEQPDALVYPQVLVLVSLLTTSRTCEWLALPTVREGAAEPSGIHDADGRAYWSVESRWRQLKSFEALLLELDEQNASDAAQQMLKAHRQRVFHMMTSAMKSESPALAAAFDTGARTLYTHPTTAPKLTNLPIVKNIAQLFRRA